MIGEAACWFAPTVAEATLPAQLVALELAGAAGDDGGSMD